MEGCERSGRPKEATTDVNIERAQFDHVWKEKMLRDKARQIGIKFGAVQTILTDILGMSKSQLDGSSELLTKDQKKSRPDKYLLSL